MKLENDLEEEARKSPVSYGSSVESTGWQGLYQYFDLFSVQVKSVLDHMVYYLRYGVDKKVFGFNEKGAKIIRILDERNLPRDAPSIVRKNAANIVALIRENAPWLGATIDVRDDLNHYTRGRFHPGRFVVVGVRHPDGRVTVQLPEVDGTRVLEIIKLIVNNILIFVECFIGICLARHVTKVCVAYHWSGKMDETMFTFGPWEDVEKMIATGVANPAGVLNERKG